MNKNTIQDRYVRKIDYENRKGHILYVYENKKIYLENMIQFIEHSLKQGYQLLIIEKEENYQNVNDKLQTILSPSELSSIFYMNDESFIKLSAEASYSSLYQYFTEIFVKINCHKMQVNCWIHLPVKEDINEKINIHEVGKILTDEYKLENNLLVAINGDQITASYQNKLITTYPYFMNDFQIIESLLYMPGNNPDFTVYKERKELESIIKATTHQLQSFIMHNLDSVFIINNEDVILTVNKAFEKIFGWKSQDIIGKYSSQLPHIPESEKEKVYQDQCKTLLGENVEEYESIRITKEGVQLHVMLSSFPLIDEYNKITGRAAIIRDMTEKKQAQEFLIKTEKLSIAGELAAGIAHEIRNPVTAIKGFLQLMEHEEQNNKVYYEIMEAEIERIELILSELLMLSKPQAVHVESTNIHVLIKDVVLLLEAEAIMNNVQIEMDFESEDIFINCEKNQLKQVSINFIKNAIEAMGNGGKLIIQIKNHQSKQVIIRFIDEGCGISSQVLAKLGQPFYTTKEKGTGLGFMVSKKIIENHHGEVSVISKENIGTTIEVRIPL